MDVPFINRLPPELLVVIVTFIADQYMTFRLATVCRHWHDVLTGAPALWTSIDCRSKSRTSILLQRSKSSPINVVIDHADYEPEAASLVASHTHRVRSINVTLYHCTLEDFYSLLGGPAPILRAMQVQGRGYIGLSLHSSSFQGRFPALRSLWVEGYPFNLARSVPMMTNGLTKLVLCNQGSHHLRDLLDYLDHCKNLEHLKIELHGLGGIVPASCIVSLPNLRELELVRSMPNVLYHLSFPPSTDLIIQLKDTVMVYDRADRPRFLDSRTEFGIPHIFDSRTIKSIKITFSEFICEIELSGHHFALTAPVMNVNIHSPGPSSYYSDWLDSLQSLPIKATESCRFAQPSPHPSAEIPSQQSYTRLLTQMPALEQITSDIVVAPSLIPALEPVDGDLLCPKLRDLIITRWTDREADIWDSLLALSKRRKDHGCPLVCSVGSDDPSDWQRRSLA